MGSYDLEAKITNVLYMISVWRHLEYKLVAYEKPYETENNTRVKQVLEMFDR